MVINPEKSQPSMRLWVVSPL